MSLLPAPRHEPTRDGYVLLGIADHHLKKITELAVELFHDGHCDHYAATAIIQRAEYALCRIDSPGHECLVQDESGDVDPYISDKARRTWANIRETDRD